MSSVVKFLDGEDNPKAVPFILTLSIAVHIAVFIVVPFLVSLHWKPRILSRPPTFEIIQIQTPQPQRPQPKHVQPAARPQQAPRPVVQEPKIEPKPSVEKKIEPKRQDTPKPGAASKPAEEDISDLESLFAEPTTSSSVSLQISEPFEYQWYLDQLQSKIKNRWKPAANEKGEVIVQFVISRNGSMSGLKLISPSGRGLLDRQAMQAVEMSAPFASLPSGFSGQSLTVNLTLKPQK
ncbi:MAG: TonB family protein [Chitinispirillales bacterium]|jgi:TonB family protein|nr:TonB family protein [Chitinispirillales bacterium]